jgi:hypothetical protein
MKTLKQFNEASGYLKVKSSDEQRFIDKHGVEVMPDANGNKDDVFKASKVKKIERTKERKGYEPGADEAVYEEADLEEKKLTPAEMKKREEVAKAIRRSNLSPGLYRAIATSTAKKVAEDLDAAISELPSRLQDIMKDAFNRLNEENQQKFVAACATEEGCEKMIAFAIEKRAE